MALAKDITRNGVKTRLHGPFEQIVAPGYRDTLVLQAAHPVLVRVLPPNAAAGTRYVSKGGSPSLTNTWTNPQISWLPTYWLQVLVHTSNWIFYYYIRVLFENRPALYFCNYISITAHKMYNFWFRIKDTVYFFIANNNYDSNNENIAP